MDQVKHFLQRVQAGKEPALTAAAIVAVFVAFLGMARALGWLDLDDEQAAKVIEFLEVAIPVVMLLVGGLWTRAQVTPVIDPRDNQGRPFIGIAPDQYPAAPPEVKGPGQGGP